MKKSEKKFDQNKYMQEYQKENYDRIVVLAPKGTKADWKARADKEGKSVSKHIIDRMSK